MNVYWAFIRDKGPRWALREIYDSAHIVLLTQHVSLQLSFIETSQSSLRTAATHQTLTIGWLRKLPCQTHPSIVTSQRNHMIQKWETQKSFNGLSALVHGRERERMKMSVCLLWGEWTPDAIQANQILSWEFGLKEEKVIWVDGLKYVVLGRWWQSHSASEERRKPV